MLNFLFDGCVWLIRKIIRLPLLWKDMLYLPLSRKQIILMFIRKRLQKHTHYITIRFWIYGSSCVISTVLNSNVGISDATIAEFSFRISGFTALIVGIIKLFCHQLHEQLIQEPSKSCFKIFFIPVANIVNNNRVFPVLVRI